MLSLKVKALTIIIISVPAIVQAHTETAVVDTGRPALIDCKGRVGNIPTSFDQPRVTAIFERIYSRNRESFRQISKASSDFCVYATNESSINAQTIVQTGQINVNRGLSQRVPSEEGMAAIIAHEAGHILMNAADPIPFNLRATESKETVALLRASYAKHEDRLNVRYNRSDYMTLIQDKISAAVNNDTNPERKARGLQIVSKLNEYYSLPMNSNNQKSHPLVTDDKLYGELIELGKIYDIRGKAVEDAHKKVLDLNAEISSMEQTLLSELGSKFNPKIFSNFVEREADEVGFELYVRAGYDPEKYEEGILSLIAAKSNLKDANEARLFCADQAKKGLVTETDDSHPAPCFRVENIRRELRMHRDYYDWLHATANNPSASGSSPHRTDRSVR